MKPIPSHLPSRKVHKIGFADTDPNALHAELLAFEAFCEKRSEGTEMVQMQKHCQITDDDGTLTEETTEGHADGNLCAHMTKNQNKTTKKPMPGNINRLLSKVQWEVT